jgi:hypothetical protein
VDHVFSERDHLSVRYFYPLTTHRALPKATPGHPTRSTSAAHADRRISTRNIDLSRLQSISLPRFGHPGFLSALANNWQINAIESLYSGLPFTVLSGADRSRSGIGNDYADVIGNPAAPAGANQVLEFFNTAAVAQAIVGTFGNVGRNTVRGPGFFDVDASVFRSFNLTERFRLQFRAEAFNIENRLNFQNPNSTVSSGVTFGRITAANDSRVLQFALKLFF